MQGTLLVPLCLASPLLNFGLARQGNSTTGCAGLLVCSDGCSHLASQPPASQQLSRHAIICQECNICRIALEACICGLQLAPSRAYQPHRSILLQCEEKGTRAQPPRQKAEGSHRAQEADVGYGQPYPTPDGMPKTICSHAPALTCFFFPAEFRLRFCSLLSPGLIGKDPL